MTVIDILARNGRRVHIKFLVTCKKFSVDIGDIKHVTGNNGVHRGISIHGKFYPVSTDQMVLIAYWKKETNHEEV